MDVMIAAGGTLLQHREESLSPLHVRNGRKTEVWAKRALWSPVHYGKSCRPCPRNSHAPKQVPQTDETLFALSHYLICASLRASVFNLEKTNLAKKI